MALNWGSNTTKHVLATNEDTNCGEAFNERTMEGAFAYDEWYLAGNPTICAGCVRVATKRGTT